LEQYQDTIIKQDLRAIKARIGTMLGFKRFPRAKVTITGIERLHRIRKINSTAANYKIKPAPRPRCGMPYSPHEKQPKHNPVSAKLEIYTRAISAMIIAPSTARTRRASRSPLRRRWQSRRTCSPKAFWVFGRSGVL